MKSLSKMKNDIVSLIIELEYDAYGVVKENNIDPLPAAIHKIRISRIICYMIMFLIILVNAKESKQNKKTLAIILMGLGYGDL